MVRMAWLALMCGCSFRHGAASGDAGVVDGPVDGMADAEIDANTTDCYGTGVVKLCVVAPTQPLIIASAQTLDTDSSGLCGSYSSSTGLDACVIGATAISVSAYATLSVTGTRPLVLVSPGSISLASRGVIDVSSHRGTNAIGPGADPLSCSNGSPPTETGTGGGGAGGSHGGIGGAGGAGGSGGAGGAASSGNSTDFLGGCSGMVGAPALGGGEAGHGGGALALISRSGITVTGAINASGAGGGGASSSGGGGGGGAGGMVVLDAPNVGIFGYVFADGGGGGGGANATSSGGAGGEAAAPAIAGPGGTGAGTGGSKGGNGSSAALLNGAAGQLGGASGGGGGGGGAAGVIRIYGTPMGAVANTNSVAPPPS